MPQYKDVTLKNVCPLNASEKKIPIVFIAKPLDESKGNRKKVKLYNVQKL